MPPIDELFPTAGEAAGEATAGIPAGTTAGPRQTLAMRLAARNGQRELRAARLARLRAGPGVAPASLIGPPSVSESPSPDSVEAAEASFLEVYLRGFSAPETASEPAPERPPEAVPEAAPAAGAVLPFHAPHAATVSAAPEAASDLGKLPGAGPGLVQALGRAGLARLADLAPLAPEALAARLGPIGRLIPAAAWIAVARAETAEAETVPRRAEAATAR
jgi:predicted flap endonuclease-1-like 5' DNA nuclease